MKIKITKHAFERGKERLGLNKKALSRMAQEVFDQGSTTHDYAGELKRYLLRVQAIHKSRLRIHGHHAYAFKGENLITILHIPTKFHGAL